jgi:hypothetical protein
MRLEFLSETEQIADGRLLVCLLSTPAPSTYCEDYAQDCCSTKCDGIALRAGGIVIDIPIAASTVSTP